jgi:hypothetical protein
MQLLKRALKNLFKSELRRRVDHLELWLTYFDESGLGRPGYKGDCLSARDVMRRFDEIYEFLRVSRQPANYEKSKLVRKKGK